MKRVIQFSKLFLPMVILSAVVIASGIVGLFVRGGESRRRFSGRSG